MKIALQTEIFESIPSEPNSLWVLNFLESKKFSTN